MYGDSCLNFHISNRMGATCHYQCQCQLFQTCSIHVTLKWRGQSLAFALEVNIPFLSHSAQHTFGPRYCTYIHTYRYSMRFSFCPCENDAIKMIRLRYWPATTSRPTIAFSFQLLDWLEALLLECQVAVQDMTQA